MPERGPDRKANFVRRVSASPFTVREVSIKMVCKPCLLVVDDEADLVQSVKDLFRRDYTVLGATRAAEGLRVMAGEPVQVLMTDQRMPEMSGVEFLQQVKESYPDTVRLLFTGYADLNAVIDAINEGNVYRYITKPWKVDELKAVLKQAVDFYNLHAERKKLLEELRKKNADLQKANDELRRSNEMKQAFIRVASHELCTPLTVTTGYSELLNLSKELAEPLQPWAKQIHSANLRLKDRVDQIIKMLQAERFERPLRPREVEASELIGQAVQEVQPFLAVRKLDLDLNVDANLGTVYVEPEKIRDVLVQLLINAIKFTPDNGKVRFVAEPMGADRIRMRVTDTGIGIEPACLKHVFDPFFTRFDVSRHSSGLFEFDRRGMGLGLSVAKGFLEMHEGKIDVESELGQGTTFTLELPRDFRQIADVYA